MTEDQREITALVVAGATLAVLAAMRSGSSNLNGLGQASKASALAPPGPAGAPLSFAIGITGDNTGANGPYDNLPPGSWYFVNVCGLQPTDVVQWNYVSGTSAADFTSAYPTNWTPPPMSRSQQPAWSVLNGCWQQGQVTPLTPGAYTLLIAVNGAIVIQHTLNIGGAPGGWASGGGIQLAGPLQGVRFAVTQGQTTVGQSTGQTSAQTAATQTAAQTTAQGASSTQTATGAARAAAPGTTAAAASSGFDLSSLLTGTIMGIPTWILLVAAAGAVWYVSTRKEDHHG